MKSIFDAPDEYYRFPVKPHSIKVLEHRIEQLLAAYAQEHNEEPLREITVPSALYQEVHEYLVRVREWQARIFGGHSLTGQSYIIVYPSCAGHDVVIKDGGHMGSLL